MDNFLEKLSKHFSKLGKKGGKKIAKKYGKKYMRDLGRRGGLANRAIPPVDNFLGKSDTQETQAQSQD